MSASSDGDLLGRQSLPQVAAGEREDRPPVGQPQARRSAAGRRPARPCPAAPPTAGRRGRRRRRPASAAPAPWPWAGRAPRKMPSPSSSSTVQSRGVRGQVVGEAGARTEHDEQPAAQQARAAQVGQQGRGRRRRRCRWRSSASTSRCSDRSARSGSPARASAATTGPASGSAGSLRSRSHSPRAGSESSAGGPLAVLEAEPDQPDDGPARDLHRLASCSITGSGGLAGAGADQVGEPARERRPRRLDVGVGGVGEQADRSRGRAGWPRRRRRPARPTRGRSPASSRCGTAARRRAARPGRPGCAYIGLLASSVAPVGSSAISSWWNWSTSGESGSGPNTGSVVRGVALGHQQRADLRAVDARRAPCRRRPGPAAGRRGRSPGSGRRRPAPGPAAPARRPARG